MNKKLSKEAKNVIVREMNWVALAMADESNPDKFNQYQSRYKTLSGMLEEQKPKVSYDTLAIIGANLLGIILILKHEKLDIISTKALNFVMKGRI